MRDLGRQERAGTALGNLLEDYRGARKVALHRLPERSNQRSLVNRSASGAPKGGASVRAGLACRPQQLFPGEDQVGEALQGVRCGKIRFARESAREVGAGRGLVSRKTM